MIYYQFTVHIMAKGNKKRKVLLDHKQIGKRFIPPMLQLPAPLSEIKWANFILPELIWLGLLNECFGFLKGAELGLILALTAMQATNDNTYFGSISTYGRLNDRQKKEIINDLESMNHLKLFKEAFRPLGIFYPQCPLNFIFDDNIKSQYDKKEELSKFKLLTLKLFDRREKAAMQMQGSAIYIALGSDLVKICVRESELPNIPEVLIDYPESESSRRAGSEARATINILLGEISGNDSSDWPKYFWNNGLKIESCAMKDLVIPVYEKEFMDIYQNLSNNYVQMVYTELSDRWTHWEVDLSNAEIFEVIGALLSRQVALGEHFVCSPLLWNRQMAPIILRTMSDLYINLSWIFKNPLERSKQFIAFGIGQEKLEIEHLRSQLDSEDGENKEMMEKIIEERSAWLNFQRWHFLTEVNVGSWSGLDSRKMAEEAGCEDLFKFQFSPFSASIHNTWHFIGKNNLEICDNSLHRFHRIPFNDFGSIELDYLYQGAKYVDDTFKLFDKHINLNIDIPSAFDMLIKELDQFINRDGEQ
jgi:hypothetical protein